MESKQTLTWGLDGRGKNIQCGANAPPSRMTWQAKAAIPWQANAPPPPSWPDGHTECDHVDTTSRDHMDTPSVSMWTRDVSTWTRRFAIGITKVRFRVCPHGHIGVSMWTHDGVSMWSRDVVSTWSPDVVPELQIIISFGIRY